MSQLTPYICVADSRAALEFYGRAFGARVTHEPIVMDDGRVGHAEVSVFGCRVMMSDPFEEAGVAPPGHDRGASVSLHISTSDIDAAVTRAVAAGVTLQRGPETTGVGRVAVLRGPFGHRWFLNDESSKAE